MKISESDKTMLMWLLVMFIGVGAIGLVGMCAEKFIDLILKVFA